MPRPYGPPWGYPGFAGRIARGFALRVGATLAILATGFVSTILYLAFWASQFAWYANLAVILSIFTIVPLSIALLWIAWGIGLHRRMERVCDGFPIVE